MKKLRIAGIVLFVLIALVATLVINVVYFKPFHIDLFFERVFLEMALRDPELMTELGLLDGLGLRFMNDELTDASVRHTLVASGQLNRDLRVLGRYHRERLDPARQLSYDVLLWWIFEQVKGQRYLWHDFPVNQVIGPHSYLPTFMSTVHPLRDRRDADDYLARLAAIEIKLGQLVENLRWREAKGIRPPRFMIERVIDELEALLAIPVRDSAFYTGIARRLAGVSGLGQHEHEPLLGAVETEIRDTVYPAYRALADYFLELRPKVTTDHGAWAQPDGLAYYGHMLRYHTSSNRGAEGVHALGLREVARIEAEMRAILRHQGYDAENVGETMAALGREPRFRFAPDELRAGDGDRAPVLDRIESLVRDVERDLPASSFDPTMRPAAAIEILPIPAFTEATTPAHYLPPNLGGERAGIFFVNLRELAQMPRFRLASLTHHETVPGHHFQYGIQLQLEDMPTFRRVLPLTAYIEGWALYAEQLAWELGLVTDPYDNLGRLQAELLRAVRLVVDTGLHHYRWELEEAIDFLASRTGMSRTEARLEVERYLIAPGQACAYMVGKLEFLKLRRRAHRALGDDFSLAEFHRVVLENGALPFEILDRVVEDWLREAKGDPSLPLE